MDDLATVIGRMKARWITGNAAHQQAPNEWLAAIGEVEPEEAELRLLALAGQAVQTAFRPPVPTKLDSRPDLPPLALPRLADEHRARFCRIIESHKSDRTTQMAVLRFLAARGLTAHPADWMPTSSREETVPDVYAPWSAWQCDHPAIDPDEALTEDSWDQFEPAGRRAALLQIRQIEPEKARALIEAKAGSEAAEHRLRLIEILTTGLSEDDIAYLQQLESTDRSGKVKALAQSLLARLGVGDHTGENEKELADFLKRDKATPLRAARLRPAKLKTAAQKTRRNELFKIVSLSGLSGALGCENGDVVIEWQYGKDGQADEGYADMLARTLPDDLVPAAIDGWLASKAALPTAMPALSMRLPAGLQQDAVRKAASRPAISFADLVALAGDELGTLSLDDPHATPAFKAVIGQFKEAAQKDHQATRTRLENLAGEQLVHLGLLVDQTTAEKAIETLIAEAGLLAADPRLAMLRLNADLPAPANQSSTN